MEAYYQDRRQAQSPQATTTTLDKSKALTSEFDRYRKVLMERDDGEGWASELRRYLKDRPVDVTRDTDIVEWWQVTLKRLG